MTPQNQPNRWSCLPTAFAIVCDVPVSVFIDMVGHDGSEIIWPELPEPFKRRSFNVQEMIDPCLNMGLAPIRIETYPHSYPRIDLEKGYKLDGRQRLTHYVGKYDGVMIGEFIRGKPHAAAWNHAEQRIYNTNNLVTMLENFHLEEFWMVMELDTIPREHFIGPLKKINNQGNR